MAEDALDELEQEIMALVWAKAQDDFYTFVQVMAPYEIPDGFQDGEHIKTLCAELQRIEETDGGRLMISLPPRSMKSVLTSILFPAWCFGRHPSWQMMSLSHSNELAKDFGRRIRNMIGLVEYQKIFPGTSLSPDSRAAHKWGTTKKGVYNSAGVETGLAGKGANLGLVDDPLSEQTANTKQGRDFVKNLWGPGFRSRMQPNGKIVIVMCMTGDTPVLMSDGTEKELKDIRSGDMVASYHEGRLIASEVKNWANQGPDYVYEIRTQSGRKVKANERHPFLVVENGVETWVRLKDLKVGNILLATGVNGAGFPVPSAKNLQFARGFVPRTTTNKNVQPGGNRSLLIQLHGAPGDSNIDTEFLPTSIKKGLQNNTGVVQFVSSCQPPMFEHIGAESCVSTTTTPQAKSEDCSAMTAISPLGMENPRKSCSKLLDTYEITLDAIVSIKPVGREDVFDIQVEGTENFIANGLASHNTRWHEDDLVGWLLSLEKKGGVDKWRVVNIPAIIDEDTPQERSYWPEYWSLKSLKDKRDDPSLETAQWNALYQGNPTPAKGVLMLREDFLRWPSDRKLPKCDTILMSCDTAFTDKTVNDPSSLQVWGIFSAPFTDSRGKEHLMPNALLLANRVGFWKYPELLDQTRELIKIFNPDRVIVENKASGQVLIPDLQGAGIPVHPFTPGKGNDKTSRVQAILRFLTAGRVHIPDTRWGDKLIDECAAFPKGKHDDQVDALTMALLFLRDASALYTQDSLRATDEWEDKPKTERKTYWTRLTRKAS